MEVNKEIERLLTRKDIKTRQLKFRNTGGRVRFTGRLVKRHGGEVEEKDKVKELDYLLKKVEGIYTIEWDLENWKREKGRWERVGSD